MRNPFNPSFGIQPTVLLDREEVQSKLVKDIKALDTPYRTIGDNMVGRLAEMIYQQSTNKIKKYLTNSPILILKLVD